MVCNCYQDVIVDGTDTLGWDGVDPVIDEDGYWDDANDAEEE